ncbi:Ankyrin repeat-containing domain protein [Rhypophila decipiens]
MDPISIAAAVFGIVRSISSVNTGVRWIASLKNAPTEFLDLQNELETVQGYLHTLQPILGELPNDPVAGTPRPNLTHIEQITQSLRAEAEELVQLTEAFRAQAVRLDKNGQPRIKKVRWRRSIETVSTHRDRVRRMRMELASAVGLLQPAQSTLILGVQQASRAEIQALQGLIRDETQRLELSIGERLLGNIPVTDSDQSRPTGPGQSDDAVAAEAEVPMLGQPGVVNPGQPSTELANRNASGNTGEGGRGNIRLTANLVRRCGILCLCQCHRSRRVRSNLDHNGLPRSILGGLLLDYNCIPVWDPRPCNDPRCVSRAGGNPSYISLIYLFPAWLFNKALSLKVIWGSLTDRGASLHISVPRILPFDHEIFWAIANSRLDIVQSNLSSRKVLPTDVNPAGSSLLFRSINRAPSSYSHPIAELFLSLTKDVNVNAFWGRSVFQYAIIDIRTREGAEGGEHLEHSIRAIWEEIYRRGEEDWEYSTSETLIHKALYHIGTDLTLEEALKLDSSSINSLDDVGFPPLFWACLRGDTEAVQLLLQHGADVNARTARGQTALHPSKSRKPAIVHALLEKGADINAEDQFGQTPLAKVIEAEDLASFNLLLSHGAHCAPIRDLRVPSVVHNLAGFPNPSAHLPMLEGLVQRGYDINVPNGFGETPILRSVWYNTTVGVKALAAHGADLTVRDNKGKTILHIAAKYATHDVFRELQGRLPGLVNPRSLDNEGKTAMDYLHDRLPLPDEDVHAFESLVQAVRIAWEQQAVRINVVADDSSDENDEFFDAEDKLES